MTRTPRTPLILLALAAACSSNPDASPSAGSTTAPADASTASTAPPQDESSADVGSAAEDAGGDPNACTGATQVVTFTTSDGVTLEADFLPSGQVGGKAAVLLHMIPPSNDRSNYPASFIDALAGAGYTVLNVDRRGAGNSGGEPQAAYEGPAGKEDARAAVAYLGASSCAVPEGEIVFVGASNGTTTAIDYTVDATARPKALVLLSPGTYTENQNRFADHHPRLPEMPIFFGYPDSERRWPESVRSQGGKQWVFEEYDGGGHGSRLFGTSPQVTADILAFLEGA